MVARMTAFGVLFLALLLTPQAQAYNSSQDERDPSLIYKTLQQQAELAMVSGSEAERSKLKDVRKQLTSDPAGVLFAIGKLQQINRSETVDFRNDCKSDVPKVILTNFLSKVQLIEALAEAYSQLSADLQSKILQALESTYTPLVACDLHGGRTAIDWGLIYIGKDAIGVLVRLAKSPMKSVRCGADDLLNAIVKMPESTRPAPILDCEAAESSSGQLEKWCHWWQQNSSLIDFSTLVGDPPL